MPFIIYSALRLALIVVIGVVLYKIGLRDLLLPVTAIVLALMVSYLLLSKPREAAAVYLAERKKTREVTGERFSRAVEDDAALEDAQVATIVAGDARPAAGSEAAGAGEPDESVPGTEPAPDTRPAADNQP